MMCANNPLSFIIRNVGCFATACILHALIGCDLKSQQKKHIMHFQDHLHFFLLSFPVIFFSGEMYVKTYANS